VVTQDWTTLPDSIHMNSPEVCHECNGQAKTVYIDGSYYKIGKRNYSGWGIWSPDESNFTENGPLLGRNQSSDRAEVRALVAALEKTQMGIHVITDNQYVRNTAQYLEMGGTVHKGKHFDLWTRIKNNIWKMNSIRWVKAHLKVENASKAGVCYEDWVGNDQADRQAKEGAAKHNYTEDQKRAVREKVALAKYVQEHMI
jgi:ribonuclease HI